MEREWKNVRKNSIISKHIDFNTLCIPIREKMTLYLNPDDEGFSKEFYWGGFREPLNTYFLYHEIKKRKCEVIDIGSNIGYFALIELVAGANNVIGIEPIPQTLGYLTKNLRKFKNFNAKNIAIGNKNGKMKLYITKKFNLTSFNKSFLDFYKIKIVDTINIVSYTISSLIRELPSSPNVLRMDIEGCEYDVLMGRIPDSIDLICMELHSIYLGKEKVKKLLQYFDDLGFKCKWFIHDMSFTLFPLCKVFGIIKTYTMLNFPRQIESENNPMIPLIEKNKEMKELIEDNRLKKINSLHLFLER